jgi:kynurenine formamidase
MILTMLVIDVHDEAAKNPDYTLGLERLKKWEADHGAIPAGAFVAMRTDWSKRWPDGAAMDNKDSSCVAHYPGWTMAALKYLYENLKITASGHETTDTDPGVAALKDDYLIDTYILSTNHYQIKLLANLAALDFPRECLRSVRNGFGAKVDAVGFDPDARRQ